MRMFTFSVTKSNNSQIDVLAAKQVIQNGDLILFDINNHVVASFAKAYWISCVRTDQPENQ